MTSATVRVGKAENRGDDVQAGRAVLDDGQVLPLHRPKAQVVDLFKLAGTLEVRGRMARSPSARHTRRQACSRRRARRGVPRDRWAIMGSTPSSMSQAECLAPVAKQHGQFLVGIELEAKGQLHPVPQRLQQAVFVRRLSSSVKSAIGIGCTNRLPPKMLCLSKAKYRAV